MLSVTIVPEINTLREKSIQSLKRIIRNDMNTRLMASHKIPGRIAACEHISVAELLRNQLLFVISGKAEILKDGSLCSLFLEEDTHPLLHFTMYHLSSHMCGTSRCELLSYTTIQI